MNQRMRAIASVFPAKNRDIAVLVTAQFSLAFAINFMYVFLPFYVQAISPLDEAATLRWTGLIVGAASAAVGAYGLSRLAARLPTQRLVLACGMGASVFQILLILGVGPVTFTLIRMAQSALAAGIFPLILVQLASRSHGGTIGFINAARFSGNAAGPVVATVILANSDLLSLCLVLGMGLAAACHHLGQARNR
ncbi:MAG: hypothetical protein ACHQ5A_10270 [Opitutales bacterium]